MRTAVLALALAASSAHAALPDGDIPAARVVLPWSDFKTLYEKGMAPEDKPEPAPRDYAVSRAVYDGRSDDESTVFNAKVRLDILKQKGWTAARILPTTVALRQARIGAADAPIYLDGGWYTYITDKPGAVTLDLEFAVNTWESSGQNGFAFALASSGGTELTLSVPGSDALEFKVANAQQTTDEVKGDRRVLHALLPATGNLSVTWEKKAPEPRPEELVPRVYAEHQSLVGVGEGVLTCRSTANYSVLHAGVKSFQLSLPGDVTVLEVEGTGIRDWTVSDNGGRKAIAVDLSFEAKGAYSLYVDYERALPEGGGTIEVPDFRTEGVERVKGWIGVDARSTLEIAAGKPENASVVDVRELPAAILGQTDWPVLYAFKYRKDGWKVPVELRQHAEIDLLVTIVDQAAATTVLTADGRRMTQVIYAMRNNRAQFLRLKMPEGATLWSTFVGGRAAKPARAEDGRVLVPLARSQTSGGELAQFAVEIVYVEDGQAPEKSGRGTFQASLPIADVPSTAVAWTVWVPRGAKVRKRSIEGSLRRVDWFTPIQAGGPTAYEAANAIQQQAVAQFAGESAAAGVEPVKVALPVDGTNVLFEKLLVFDEPLKVTFDYKGLKRR